MGRATLGRQILMEEMSFYSTYREIFLLALAFPKLVELTFPGLNTQVTRFNKTVQYLIEKVSILKLTTLDGSTCQWVKYDYTTSIKKY
jgi:hypothetical protein